MKIEEIKNKVINADCLDVMAGMPDNCIDLVVTSPPYDNLRDYQGYTFNFENIAKHLCRVVKDGGIIVWIVGDSTVKGSETLTSFKQALYFNEIGLNLHDTMFYHKVGITLNHNRYEQEIEYMFVFSKGSPKTFNPIKIPCLWYNKDSDRTGQNYREHNEKQCKLRSGKSRGNIKKDKIKGNLWSYQTGFGHTTKDKNAFEHPAVFPENLAGDHIVSWSNKGDVVLDPMCGSGTVLKECRELGRTFIGIEIAEKYCKISEQRLSNTTPSLF